MLMLVLLLLLSKEQEQEQKQEHEPLTAPGSCRWRIRRVFTDKVYGLVFAERLLRFNPSTL